MLRTVCILAGLILALASGFARAELENDSELLLGQIGYTLSKSNFTKETQPGGSYGISFEKVSGDRMWSAGIAIVGLDTEEDGQLPNGNPASVTYTSTLATVYGRFLFGISRIFTAYVGFGGGINFSSARITEEIEGQQTYRQDSENGLALSIPIGVFAFVSRSFFLSGNYTYNYLGKNPYIENKVVNAFNLGLGFQF